MTITLHHLQYSQSFRILWLLEALGADYELKIYPRDPASNLAPADYKAVSPLGTAPVLTHGDVALAETNAIIDYVLDLHPDSGFRPAPGSPERERYLFWFHATQGSMMPLLLIDTIFKFMGARAPALMRPLMKAVLAKAGPTIIQPRMKKLLQLAETHLSQHKWLAGDDLTAADFTMSYALKSAHKKGFVTEAHPGCLRWLAQMEADPAFQAAQARDDGREIVFSI